MSNIHISLPVGRVKGPGPTPHSFSFVAFAQHQALKVGEFIVCPVELAGTEQPLLARVVKSLSLRVLPNTFLSAPTLWPSDVAASLRNRMAW